MNKYFDIIHNSGFKLTSPRIGLIKYLYRQKKPLTIRDIYLNLKSKVDLSSIYRNLQIFKKLGFIFEEEIKRERHFYLATKQHHHIVCRRCGYIQCISCNNEFYNIKNFTQVTHKLSLTGLCSKCAKKL